MKRGAVKALIIVSSLVLVAAVGTLVVMLFGERIWSSIIPQPTTAPVTTEAPTTEPPTEPTTEEKRVEVPNVVGMTADKAYETLNLYGVRYTVSRQYSDTVKADTVISQSPLSGMILQSERVTVYISKGVDNTAPATQPTSKPKKKDESSGSSEPDDPAHGGGTVGDYIISGSDTHIISASEVRGLSKEQMTLALNEIYARHGRRFNTAYIQAYFDSCSWYHGTIAPSAFDESVLTATERANINTIISVMKEYGYR